MWRHDPENWFIFTNVLGTQIFSIERFQQPPKRYISIDGVAVTVVDESSDNTNLNILSIEL